jgi:hypothetical protein
MADSIIYRSENGSEVRISGKHWGVVEIEFDWFEEEGCIEADPTFDQDDLSILAVCDCCGPQRVAVKLIALDSLAS